MSVDAKAFKRLPPEIRVVCDEAVRELGSKNVDVHKSVDHTHVTIWTPWNSDLAKTLKAVHGFRDTCINHPAAICGVESEQSVSWDLPDNPARFRLVRNSDVTGVSGTGIVAMGIRFTDGTVAMRWLTAARSTVLWDSIEDAERVHGHDGKTKVEWIDKP